MGRRYSGPYRTGGWAAYVTVAADQYHRVEELMPQDFHIQYQIAQLYLQLDNMNEAEEHLRKAIVLRPDVGPAHLNLGVVLLVLLRRGETDEGRREFLEALRWDPRLTRAYDNLGLLALDSDRFDEAEALLWPTCGQSVWPSLHEGCSSAASSIWLGSCWRAA